MMAIIIIVSVIALAHAHRKLVFPFPSLHNPATNMYVFLSCSYKTYELHTIYILQSI